MTWYATGFQGTYNANPGATAAWLRAIAAGAPESGRWSYIHGARLEQAGFPTPTRSKDVGYYEQQAREVIPDTGAFNVEEILARAEEQRQAELMNEAQRAAYWDQRRAENEQAKANFGGTRTAEMQAAPGTLIGKQEIAQKQMLESGTAQWESPEAYSKAAGQFEATTGREGVRADIPTDKEGTVQFYGVEGAAGYQTSKEANEARLTAINAAAAARAGEGMQQNKAYTDWKQPTELNPATGRPWTAPASQEDESAYAAKWWGGLSTADKIKAGAITITGNILSGTADYLGIKNTFDPMSGFELESAKAGDKQYTYQTVKQPESQGFGDFKLLAYQTVKPKWEAVAEIRKSGKSELEAVKYAATDTILSNEAVLVTGSIAAFGAGLGAVAKVAPKVAAIAGAGVVVAGVGSAAVKTATGQAREGFIEGVPFLLMAPQAKGLIKGVKPPSDLTTKMFGRSQPVKPAENVIDIGGGRTITVRPQSYKEVVPPSDYPFDVGGEHGITVARTPYGMGLVAVGGAAVTATSAKATPSESDYQKAYEVAKDVSAKPEYANDVIRVNEPRSPAKVETMQNKNAADAYGKQLAAELKAAGVNAEYNKATGAVERVPDKFDINKGKEKVLDIEYFNKAKEQQKTKFNKDFGSENLKGAEALSIDQFRKPPPVGDVSLFGRMFGVSGRISNAGDAPSIDVFKSMFGTPQGARRELQKPIKEMMFGKKREKRGLYSKVAERYEGYSSEQTIEGSDAIRKQMLGRVPRSDEPRGLYSTEAPEFGDVVKSTSFASKKIIPFGKFTTGKQLSELPVPEVKDISKIDLKKTRSTTETTKQEPSSAERMRMPLGELEKLALAKQPEWKSKELKKASESYQPRPIEIRKTTAERMRMGFKELTEYETAERAEKTRTRTKEGQILIQKQASKPSTTDFKEFKIDTPTPPEKTTAEMTLAVQKEEKYRFVEATKGYGGSEPNRISETFLKTSQYRKRMPPSEPEMGYDYSKIYPFSKSSTTLIESPVIVASVGTLPVVAATPSYKSQEKNATNLGFNLVDILKENQTQNQGQRQAQKQDQKQKQELKQKPVSKTIRETVQKTRMPEIPRTPQKIIIKLPRPDTRGAKVVTVGSSKKLYREYSNPIIKPLQGKKKGKKRGR